MGNNFHQAGIGTREGLARAPGVYRLTRRLVILTEIIAPYRISRLQRAGATTGNRIAYHFLSENDQPSASGGFTRRNQISVRSAPVLATTDCWI